MSQDVVADGLNMIKNAKQAGKEKIIIKKISNLLIGVLKIMKSEGAVQRYKIDKENKSVEVTIGDLMESKAVKPRFTVNKKQIEKYKRRYLPARNIGTLIVSTNKGLMKHEEAQKNEMGGCLIAYFY